MSYVQQELSILRKTTPDAIILPFEKELDALYRKFMSSGQSGGSAPFTAQALSQAVKKLLMSEPIAPITGEDWEWSDMTKYNDGETMFQNMRDSRIFKYADGSCKFVDAIVWNGDIGGAFFGWVDHNGEQISSSQTIKSFPFTPKTFYVDVKDFRWKDKDEKEQDPNGDWWTHEISDPTQLDEVWEYYKKPY